MQGGHLAKELCRFEKFILENQDTTEILNNERFTIHGD